MYKSALDSIQRPDCAALPDGRATVEVHTLHILATSPID